MTKKILLSLAMVALVAFPAFAGNSFRVKGPTPTSGGGGVQPAMCSPELCAVTDQPLIWNETNSCFDCIVCADNEILQYDATTGVECATLGTAGVPPALCDPEACDTDGQIMIWNESSTCINCVDCADDEVLTYDLATTTWVCTLLPVAPIDFDWCTGAQAACEAGGGVGAGNTDIDLFWDPVSDCFYCEERQLWRHQDDTFMDSDYRILGGADSYDWYLSSGDVYDLTIGSYFRMHDLGGGATTHTASHFWVTQGTQQLIADTYIFDTTGADTTKLTINASGWAVRFADAAGATWADDKTYLDLSLIDHDSTDFQGFQLPQNATANFTDMTTADEGFVAWSTDANELYCNDGTTWAPCSTSGGAGTYEVEQEIFCSPGTSETYSYDAVSGGSAVSSPMDATTAEYAYCTFTLPADFDDSVQPTITLQGTSDGTTAACAGGTGIVIDVDTRFVGDGELGAAAAFGTIATDTFTNGCTTVHHVWQRDSGTFILNGTDTAGDAVGVRIKRDVADAADDYPYDWQFSLNALVHYTVTR